jgi:hypothetical protein
MRLTILLLLLSTFCFSQQIDSVYKDSNGVWRGRVSGPIGGNYQNATVADTTAIHEAIIADNTPDPEEPPPGPSTPDYDFLVTNVMDLTSAANMALTGDTVMLREGVYRTTVTPTNNGVIFINYPGEVAKISGLEWVTTSWVVHSGSIYKTTITLPVNGHQSTLTSNTSLLSNQLFKDGAMQFEARWPNISSEADLLNITKFRHVSQTNGVAPYWSFNPTNIQDNGLPIAAPGLAGAKLVAHGWFWPHTRVISSHSGSQINFPEIQSGNYRYRKYYYLTGKLALLDADKEWHYENGTLYFRQTNGGLPTGVEYKKRNWGFDLRGKSNTVIKGLHFVGCEPMTGDVNTAHTLVEGINAKYLNHSVMMDVNDFPGYGNAKQTGFKLIGSYNTLRNSVLQYAATGAVWLGEHSKAVNNYVSDWGYEGSWSAPFDIWGDYDNQKILNNTITRTGRSSIDLGYSYIPGTGHNYAHNLNIEISMNDMSMWGMLNIDLGAIYAWGFRDLTGLNIHHNWFHDDGVVADPTGAPLDGGQRAMYLDQAAGPMAFHHNIMSGNWTGLPTNAGDMYVQMSFENKTGTASKIYNNGFYSTAQNSYTTYESGPKDDFQNNIFAEVINMNWGAHNPPNEKYNLFIKSNTNATVALGVGSVKNTPVQFASSGAGSLAFTLASTSPARNTGVVLAGFTTDDDSTPDKGPRRYGDPNPWVPGYVPVAEEVPSSLIEDSSPLTVFSEGKVTTHHTDYSGGSASYTNIQGSEITVTFTGTAFEWWTEKFQHHGVVEIKIDGTRQDCDPVTSGVQDCDLYQDTNVNNSQKVFTKTGMSAGQHTIKFKLVGQNTAVQGISYMITDVVKNITP